MRFLSTRTHSVLDYVVGALLIGSPWLLGFNRGGAETWVPVTLGLMTLIASLFTRYEMGVIKVIPMKVHLTLDFLSGALLAVSPWLFGFADFVSTPHVVFGLFEIGASIVTKTKAADVQVHGHQPA